MLIDELVPTREEIEFDRGVAAGHGATLLEWYQDFFGFLFRHDPEEAEAILALYAECARWYEEGRDGVPPSMERFMQEQGATSLRPDRPERVPA